jgi:hypothetical protein
MARQNPLDDSCVGVLFRGLVIVVAFTTGVIAAIGWIS